MPSPRRLAGNMDSTQSRMKQSNSTLSLRFRRSIGILIDFLGINPMTALFWTAVINGLLAPPLLVVIMFVSNNKKVMGDKVNGWFTNIMGWTATAIMFAAAIGLIVT